MSVCLSVPPPVCLSVPPSVCLSVPPPVCLSVPRLSVSPSLRLSVPPSVCLSVPPSVCLSVPPSVCLSVPPSVCLSVPPSVCLSVPLSGRLSFRPHGTTRPPLDGFFSSIFRKSLEKIQISLNLTRITGALFEDLYAFMIISDSVLLRMGNVSDKSCRHNQNTHFTFNNFFRKACRL
jgi:hypothetical protein